MSDNQMTDDRKRRMEHIPGLDDYELPPKISLDSKKMKPNRFAGKVKLSKPQPITDENAPYALRNETERKRRMEMLTLLRNKPLHEFVVSIRQAHIETYHIPNFDPCDGGYLAKVLFLLEAPGPKAVESGFISRNNPDPTANNMCELLDAAGINRKDTLLWNVIPWYIGENEKIRGVRRSDFEEAIPYLGKLLNLLPKLHVIVLVGKKAQSKREHIAVRSKAKICEMWHPSRRVQNSWPDKWNEIPTQLECVAKELAK